MTLYFPDFQRACFLRTPDWRWQRAHYLVQHNRYFSCRRDDEDTGRAVHYLRALARCPHEAPSPRLLHHFEDIHKARQLYQGGGVTRLLVQARLLARQTSQEISSFTGIPAQAVEAYQALFFHCKDHLDARDWITHQCIVGTDVASEPAHAVLFRAFAYHGGPLVLEAVRPYLLDGKDLFDPPVDLSTPEGRKEQMIRLAIAVHLLPHDAATDKRLFKIMLLQLKTERNRPFRAPATSLLATNLDFGLSKLPGNAASEHLSESKIPFLAAALESLREAA